MTTRNIEIQEHYTVFAIELEGEAQARAGQAGGTNPYPPNTWQNTTWTKGWVSVKLAERLETREIQL